MVNLVALFKILYHSFYQLVFKMQTYRSHLPAQHGDVSSQILTGFTESRLPRSQHK